MTTTTEQQRILSHLVATNPKELLSWDPGVLQHIVNVGEWFTLVGQQEYEVLAHVLQHKSPYLGLVSKVVAHSAVSHQDIVLISTVPHLRPDIEQMLATAQGPFRSDFLDVVQKHFMDRTITSTVSPVLDEALQTRLQQKRLQEVVGKHTVERTQVNRKL